MRTRTERPTERELQLGDLLDTLDEGKVKSQLQLELRNIVEAVCRTQSGGKLAVELLVKPQGEGAVITVKHKSTVPLAAPVGRLVYLDPDRRLTSRNPERYPALPFEGEGEDNGE